MKKNISAVTIVALFMLASCGGSSSKDKTTNQQAQPAQTGEQTMQEEMKKPAGTPKINIKKEDLANQQDPVCGMPAFKFLKDTAVVNGKIYGFCGSGCKDEFAKNTKQYVK